MANELAVLFDPTGQTPLALPDTFGVFGTENDDLVSGVGASYGIVSFRGKVWRIKHQNSEKLVLDPTTKDPIPRLRAVILNANGAVSKTFYADRYDSGSTEAPDCASIDGIRPDVGVKNKQNDYCASCPQNQWGSVTTDSGKKGKACSDNRRLAIVPSSDIRNEADGGPMLLRVPVMSLPALIELNDALKAQRVPYFAAIVDIGFDPKSEYPKLTFKPVAVITSAPHAAAIMELRESTQVQNILHGVMPVDSGAVAAPLVSPEAKATNGSAPPPKATRKANADAATKAGAAAAKKPEPEQEPPLDAKVMAEMRQHMAGVPPEQEELGLGLLSEVATAPAPATAAPPVSDVLSEKAEGALSDLLKGLGG